MFDLNVPQGEAPSACISAEILKGLKKPTDCSAFGNSLHTGKPARCAYGFF